jgi:hypothetical protein
MTQASLYAESNIEKIIKRETSLKNYNQMDMQGTKAIFTWIQKCEQTLLIIYSTLGFS